MPDSRQPPECLRHSRRKKSLAGQKDGRHFAVRRKTGIFPAKNAFPTCHLAASEIATGNFDAAVLGTQKFPGWPAPGFRVLSPRDIYGTFCPGAICPGKAGRRRKYRPATGVSVGTNLSHSACMRRKGFFPQLIRRRRKMPQVFFAWCRGLKSVFAPFWGCGQKGVAARTHAEDAASGRAAKLRRRCGRYVCR